MDFFDVTISLMVGTANWWVLVLCYLVADMVNTFRVQLIIPIGSYPCFGWRSLHYSVRINNYDANLLNVDLVDSESPKGGRGYYIRSVLASTLNTGSR